MEIKETIAAALKEIIFFELQELKRDIRDLKSGQAALHTRLNDHNAHLMDMSRRLDELRQDLSTRIDQVRSEMSGRLNHLDSELNGRIDRFIDELVETNRSIARLYEVIVRRDDYQQLQERVARIENQVAELRQKVAA